MLQGSVLLITATGFNKRNNKTKRWAPPDGHPIRPLGSEIICWQFDGILSLQTSFFDELLEMSPLPFKAYSHLTPQASLVLFPEVITMIRCILSMALCGPLCGPLWHHKGHSHAWSSVSRCQGRKTHLEATYSLLRSFSSLPVFALFMPFCFLVWEMKIKAHCGRFLWKAILNLATYTRTCPNWVGSMPHWIVLIVLFVILTFLKESDESKVQTPPIVQGWSFGSLGQKSRNSSPNKICIFNTLNWIKMDFVKFASRMQKWKLTT